jgi:hypothetical protein
VTHEGDLSKPFALGGIRVEDVLGPGKPEGIDTLEELSGEATARKTPAEALAHLETLDQEILAELRRLRKKGEIEAPPDAPDGAEDEVEPGFEPVRVPRRRS